MTTNLRTIVPGIATDYDFSDDFIRAELEDLAADPTWNPVEGKWDL